MILVNSLTPAEEGDMQGPGPSRVSVWLGIVKKDEHVPAQVPSRSRGEGALNPAEDEECQAHALNQIRIHAREMHGNQSADFFPNEERSRLHRMEIPVWGGTPSVADECTSLSSFHTRQLQ